jgi:hypothetical protein
MLLSQLNVKRRTGATGPPLAGEVAAAFCAADGGVLGEEYNVVHFLNLMTFDLIRLKR